MTSHYLVLSGKSSKFNFWTCKTIVFTGFPEDGSIKSAQYPESCNDSQISVAPFMNWKSKQHPLKCNVFLHSGDWWYFQKFTITFQVERGLPTNLLFKKIFNNCFWKIKWKRVGKGTHRHVQIDLPYEFWCHNLFKTLWHQTSNNEKVINFRH